MPQEENIASNRDFEELKFMMDCCYKEAALFWNRNNVFLVVNLASLSAALAYFSDKASISNELRLGVGVFGLLICIIWILVIRAGRGMNHAWTAGAKRLAMRLGSPEIVEALGRTPSEGAFNKKEGQEQKVNQINLSSATSLMYLVAGVFALAWALIAFFGSVIFS